MKIERIKLSDLVFPDKNTRIHTEKQLVEFARSLERFGQTRPAVVDENNMLLIGNGMVKAMERIGMESLDVYRKEGLSETDKKKLMLADNKIYSLGLDDYDAVEQILAGLSDYDIPGYDEEILKSMQYTAEEVTQKLNDYGTLDEEEIKAIKNNGARKEAAIQKAEEKKDETLLPSGDRPHLTGSMDNMKPVEPQRFVTCPKCGEKICI